MVCYRVRWSSSRRGIGSVVSKLSSSGDARGTAAARLDHRRELVGETRTESEDDDGGVTRPPPPASEPGRTEGSTRDRLFRVPSWSGGSELAELSVRLDLSMHFGGPAFSFSVTIVIGGGMSSTSASDAKETTRAACEAVRGRADECGGITWTGYGDS